MSVTPNNDMIAVLLSEYEYLGRIRERHMASYTKTNFYFGMIIVILGAAIINQLYAALLLIPLIVMIQLSIVMWNQYHHFLTEEYLCAAEKKLNAAVGFDGGGALYHNFYLRLFNKTAFIKHQKSNAGFIKPTALLSAFLAIFNIGISLYCILVGKKQFVTEYGLSLYYTYLVIVIIMFIMLATNFILMPKFLRLILKDELLDFQESNATGEHKL